MLRRLIACLLVLLLALNCIGQNEDDTQPISEKGEIPPEETITTTSSHHKQTDIDNLIKIVKGAKEQEPEKYDELQKLLYLKILPPDTYIIPKVNLRLQGNNNTTNINVTRNQPIIPITNIYNKNPLELRRPVYLTMSVKNPGDDKFVDINRAPMIIQTNEYKESKYYPDSVWSSRTWHDLPSFAYLSKEGEARVKVNWSDGYSYSDTNELVFNIVNAPPAIRNATVTGPDSVRYTDPIIYEAKTYDPDKDTLNVTLHILDDRGSPKMNLTQQAKGGSPVIFRAADWGSFNEQDAGKNFTYYYSVDDGISNNTTKINIGPSIKPIPNLTVTDVQVVPENDNRYWWQKYNFSFKVSNQALEPVDVLVTLYTNTPAEPKKSVQTKSITATADPHTEAFEVWPFSVKDAGEEFTYFIEFSEDVQGADGSKVAGTEVTMLNQKIVKFNILDPVIVVNLLSVMLLTLLGGILIERKLKKGEGG